MARTPVFLYEFTYYNTDTSAEEVLRLASEPYVTKPTDSPANTIYDDRLVEAGSFESFMYSRGQTIGNSSSGFGELVASNNDRALDYLEPYAFDLRSFVIKTVASPESAYSTATTIYMGLIEQVEFSLSRCRFIIRDALVGLDIESVTATFAGTNADVDDLEGTADDVKGKLKPFVYGKVENIAPPLVNDSSLIYGCNFDLSGATKAISSVDAVYDNGVLLTLDTTAAGSTAGDYATVNAMATATIVSGRYVTCKAHGLFRLHSSPAGQVTADITEGSSAANRTAAQVAFRLIDERTEYGSGDFESGTLTALDAKNSAVVGIYVDSDKSVLDCVNEVLASIGAAPIATTLGKFRFARLEAPAVSAVFSFTEDLIYLEGFQRTDRSDQNNGLPFWKIEINYRKNYTTQAESDLAGAAITNGRVEYTKREYRTEVAEDAAVKTTFKKAEVLTIDTLLANLSDAATEASRVLTLRKELRAFWTLPTTETTIYNHGDTIEIVYPAFGMTNGQKFVILGYEIDFSTNEVTYTVFG